MIPRGFKNYIDYKCKKNSFQLGCSAMHLINNSVVQPNCVKTLTQHGQPL